MPQANGMLASPPPFSAFQYNHGALPTGHLDERTRQDMNISAEARLYQLKDNAPRITEHMRDLGPRYVAVNIPAAQLESVELGQLYSRHNVVVGKLDRPTPSLKSRVSDILFNPTWSSPASIVAKDIIPKMMQDAHYLQGMGIHVYDGVRGPEIDPASVDWQQTPPDRFVFVQDPGDHNALGNVKINFPNKFMVYMHDTPHRELFATNDRWESSGCVRVDKVKNLITWIMNGQDGYEEANFEPIIASRETQQVMTAQRNRCALHVSHRLGYGRWPREFQARRLQAGRQGLCAGPAGPANCGVKIPHACPI